MRIFDRRRANGAGRRRDGRRRATARGDGRVFDFDIGLWGACAWLLVVGPAVLSAQALLPRPLELKELNRQARESVVLLEIFGSTGRQSSTGTGFFIDAGVLATNHHVVDGAHRVEAVLSDGSRIEVEGILASNADSDLATLRVAAGSFRPLTLWRGAAPEPGDPVVVLGNPLGLSGTLSTGIVSAVREQGVGAEIGSGLEGAPRIQITAPISPGSSGSPVLNPYGQVIGVAVSQILSGQSLNFAVPAEELVSLLEQMDPSSLELRYGTKGSGVPPALVRNLLISVLVFFGLVIGLRRLR